MPLYPHSSHVSLTDMQRSLVAGISDMIARDENKNKTKKSEEKTKIAAGKRMKGERRREDTLWLI